MVIALQDFGGFAGFQEWEVIRETFARYEALDECFLDKIAKIDEESQQMEFFSDVDCTAFKLKQLLEFIVDVTDTETPFINPNKGFNPNLKKSNILGYKISLPKLTNNLKKEINSFKSKNLRDEITLQLLNQYGADVGILITLMLQYVELEPLESMLLAPNVPHCYFKGEIVEIMHSSNNVIRLGLTKKFKDKKNLLKLVDYRHASLNIMNKGVKHELNKEVVSANLNDYIFNYSTEFDHLFRVKIIYRDGREEKESYSYSNCLFYLKNEISFSELERTGGEVVSSKIGPLEKDCIILNMGAAVNYFKKTQESERNQHEEVRKLFFNVLVKIW